MDRRIIDTLYFIPELYRDEEGEISINAIIYSLGEDEPQYLMGNDLPKILDLEEQSRRVVAPHWVTAVETLRIISDDTWKTIYRLHGVLDRAPAFGLPTYLRGCAEVLGLPFPRSIWRDATYFRDPAPDGTRHRPEDDLARWAGVLLYDVAALRAMIDVDSHLRALETEYYRVYEKGTKGSTSTPGFAYWRDQEVLSTLLYANSHGPILKEGVKVRRDAISTAYDGECRLSNYVRKSFFAQSFIECPVDGILGDPETTLMEAIEEGQEVKSAKVPFVPTPGEKWQRELERKIHSVLRGVETKQVRLEELKGLAIRYDVPGDYLELRTGDYFPILYRRPRIVGGELQALYQAREGEQVATQPLRLSAIVERLVNTYKYTEVAKVIQKLRSRVPLDLTLLSVTDIDIKYI